MFKIKKWTPEQAKRHKEFEKAVVYLIAIIYVAMSLLYGPWIP